MLKAASAERNKGPIADVLTKYLWSGMKVLEIASGTGQHVTHLAESFPQVVFQPSENDPRSIHSIVGYIDHYRYPNVRVPLAIDVSKDVSRWAMPQDFGPHEINAIININMIHISSNAAVTGLFKAANSLLHKQNGLLITYGPYAIDGSIYPQSNVDFDKNLRDQNAEWGLRDVTELSRLANENDLHLTARHEMPANNNILIFSRS